jgi:integrase
MPRKPLLKKQKVTVVIDGSPITVTLTPPTGTRRSWYAYWPGLVASKSTGVTEPSEAVLVAEEMIRNGGQRRSQTCAVPTDEEFEEIQRRHFAKKQSPEERRRAEKSLVACLEAISAFRGISGLKPIAAATPEDCERFQHEALKRPKNWRSHYPNSRKEVEPLSANTVIKWSVALQAAFERANRNAGKKCVRGVVPEVRLLSENPWRQFTWIRGFDRKIRQFSGEELISLLDHLGRKWPGMTVASAIAKVCLWSWGRKSEVMGLRWDQLRPVGEECHFEIVGKWGIDKWFRIPDGLHRELLALKTDSPYVFGIYKEQLRRFHERGPRPWLATRVSDEFDPDQLGDWFYERIQDWSRDAPGGRAYLHVFRKTSLQYARMGEDLNRQVAADARLGVSVMLTSYVKESDEEMRAKSNRTYRRIAASLPPEVARRYGHEEVDTDTLVQRLQEAVSRKDWDLVSRLTADLQRRGEPGRSL